MVYRLRSIVYGLFYRGLDPDLEIWYEMGKEE
jgi:hypothetical protein